MFKVMKKLGPYPFQQNFRNPREKHLQINVDNKIGNPTVQWCKFRFQKSSVLKPFKIVIKRNRNCSVDSAKLLFNIDCTHM